ncbi:EI24 domain-containing protein [Tabrizicola sp.]|uniref:EI24 domain-containing protein n=1 Tax=Tabrizicola sp. TaxID=2005166 RepID=UPI001A51549A|nr:EI24 domain-containing protein [Tabrizicola sp.]MBL9074669.1 EI24 domain-containing protein [Tabrizicola sp.]
MFTAFFKALGQLGDRRFRRVVLLGVLLALALLFGTYALFLQLIWWLSPDQINLPVIGPVTGMHTLLGWTSVLFMIGLSVFLMIPVASAFTGIFLEDVADAVEDRHYPQLPPATPLSLGEGLRQSVNFLGLVVAVNLGALFLYPFLGPGIPILFWAMNGFLLGREYFSLVALRRLPPAEVKAMRRRNRWTLWAAGTLMAAPLTVPILNLMIPVLGVATFTHIYHQLARDGR